MATDGVKIIDGDTAFDIYGPFIDAYNNGADGATITQYRNYARSHIKESNL